MLLHLSIHLASTVSSILISSLQQIFVLVFANFSHHINHLILLLDCREQKTYDQVIVLSIYLRIFLQSFALLLDLCDKEIIDVFDLTHK